MGYSARWRVAGDIDSGYQVFLADATYNVAPVKECRQIRQSIPQDRVKQNNVGKGNTNFPTVMLPINAFMSPFRPSCGPS